MPIVQETIEQFEERHKGHCIMADRGEYQRSKYTWIGNIDAALGGGNFMEHSQNFESTLKSLEPEELDDEELDDEEDPIV